MNTEDLPQLWRRFGAYIVDLYFIFMLYYLISIILPENLNSNYKIFLFIVVMLYDPLCTSLLGFTFGAFLFKIRVKDISDGSSKLNFLKAFFRYVVKLLLGWLSFLTIHSNEKKQAIHDFVANSVVVRKN